MPLAPVGYPQGLPGLTVSSPQLRVHVGESVLMGCVVQRTEEKHVDRVDWLFSKDKDDAVRKRQPDHLDKPRADGVRMGWVWENQSLLSL